MAPNNLDSEKSPFTSSGDLEDESNLNEILMDRSGDGEGGSGSQTADDISDDDAYDDIEDDKPEDEEGIDEFN